MASSSFPQLLRQTTFATFDPSISRVYTSTPSSVHKYGDWGLKKPIYRKRGPKYIKLSNMDAGRLLGSDWQSGEADARFIKAYGTGRVHWRDSNELAPTAQPVSLWSDDYQAPEEKEVDLMADVNSMTATQFKKYLESVRRYRNQYLVGKLQHLREKTLEKLKLAEDKTLVNLSIRGLVNNADITNFQVGLMKSQMEPPTSKILVSRPHIVYGMNYSRIPSSAHKVNPLVYHPGRALDRFTPASSKVRMDRAQPTGGNGPWVVSIGGAGALSTTKRRLAESGENILEGTDFERKERERGSSNFRIASAQIQKPPKVVDLGKGKYMGRRGTRDFKPATPLNTFEFEINVDSVPEEVVRDAADVGTKQWVDGYRHKKAAEMRRERERRGYRTTRDDGVMSSWDDDLGLDGSREKRIHDATKGFERWNNKRAEEAKHDNANMIANLLEQIRMRDRQSEK